MFISHTPGPIPGSDVVGQQKLDSLFSCELLLLRQQKCKVEWEGRGVCVGVWGCVCARVRARACAMVPLKDAGKSSGLNSLLPPWRSWDLAQLIRHGGVFMH